MVFVWSNLTRGDPTYTLVQVSVNDLIMVVAFAPIVALLLGVTDIVVPWDTLLLSVLLYIVVPLAAGILTRNRLVAQGGEAAVEAFRDRIKPLTMAALLITVVRDKKGDGHAVLTVKTDKGEFILDNQAEEILLWSETGYRFVKRQSQSNPNVWIALGDPRPPTSTASPRAELLFPEYQVTLRIPQIQVTFVR